MRAALGWTMLSREEMRLVERSLANNDQDTRDEIGFLLIHQGFADRFFPGTSVLHTRIRYALFVPWIYQQAAFNRRRGTDLELAIGRLLIELAIRLKQLGGEPYDVIGGDKLGQLTSQPPDRAYWSALRTWGLLLPSIESRSDALRRLNAGALLSTLDDDGGRLDDDATEVFAGLPRFPSGWTDPKTPLRFKMPSEEREFLRGKLRLLTRPHDKAQSLLARIVEAKTSHQDNSVQLPKQLSSHADPDDKLALSVARDAAALAAVGRVAYGALVERLLAADGGPDGGRFRQEIKSHFAQYGEATARCDLDSLERLLPELPLHVRTVLRETQAFVRGGDPERFSDLQDCYRIAEVRRKTSQRARLLDTERSAQRRLEWQPERHNTTPLHYRWRVVRNMLADLSDSQ